MAVVNRVARFVLTVVFTCVFDSVASGATVEVVGPKEPFLPSSGGSGPADEPDEIFNVSQSGGRLKWGCAQFAQAFDASGNSSWARVETSSGTQTVWMRFFNSSSSGVVRRIFMDPTLSVVLTVTDPSTTVAVPPPGSTLPASSDPNVGLIVGLTVGLTAAAVILTVVALVLAKRSRAKRAKEMAVKIAERENEINKERTQSMMLLPVKPVY
jgi:hypothetical protein